jgi:hypothetical protein
MPDRSGSRGLRVAVCRAPPVSVGVAATVAALRQAGHVPTYVASPDVWLSGENPAGFDVVWLALDSLWKVREWGGEEQLPYVQAAAVLVALGVPCLNPPGATTRAAAKTVSGVLFERAGLRHPRTRILSSELEAFGPEKFVCASSPRRAARSTSSRR